MRGIPLFVRLGKLAGLTLLMLPVRQAEAGDGEWSSFSWQGEKAWISTSGPWAAVVSEPRARLIFLGEWESGINLLYAPVPDSSRPYRGGHRFWLGPQSNWQQAWPPPADWESSPGKVRSEDQVLFIDHPQKDSKYPALSRSYRWDGDTLVMEAGWKGDENDGFQAMHILQLPRDAVVRMVPQISAGWPLGFGLLDKTAVAEPTAVLKLQNLPVNEVGGRLLFSGTGEEFKAGFPPTSLEAREGGVLLTLSRAATTGKVGAVPASGLLTQVYLGADRYQCDFVEIEQLSEILTPSAGVPASFTVRAKLEKLKNSPELALAWTRAETDPLPQSVPGSDPRLRYLGRFKAGETGKRSAWSGSMVQASFSGTAVNAVMSGKDSRILVLIDGKETSVLTLREGVFLYPVARGLEPGQHRLDLVKLNEPLFGEWLFQGLQLEKGATLGSTPVGLDRRIEIIGDSITCGYGNEAPWQKSRFSSGTENFFYTYGAIAARKYGAECVALSWSGRCLLPEKNVESMPELFSRILPADRESSWDFKTWQPQVVVINLGTNDLGKLRPDEAAWVEGARKFVTQIRGGYPEAYIFLAIGPMLSQEEIDKIDGYNRRLVEELKSTGDKKIDSFSFRAQRMSKGLGADWHPSIPTHEEMAQRLGEELEAKLGWKAEGAR